MPGGQSSTSPSPGGAQATQQTTADSTAQPTQLPTPDAVIASRTTSYEGTKAKVDLNQVIVTGDVTTVTWTLTNVSSKNSILLIGGTFKDTSIFSDGLTATVPGSDAEVPGDLRTADGVFLIDTVNKRRYLPARDAQGVCLCSSNPRWQLLERGSSMPFSATFRAIPEGIDLVNVSIPGAGTFVKVPVER
ncbi:hypothetical protein [Micropruina sp.]|uniref:hypothetical protein n=1 Tax=Micropruina sp. TaxID=2737536 RepID=UPI0039E67011